MKHTAYTRWEDGAVRLYVDGERTAPLIYGLSDIPASRSYTPQAQKNIAQFAAAGVDIVQVDTSLHLGWKRGGHFDIQPILREINGAVSASPQAKVIVRLHLNPPYWWVKEHPSECVVYGTAEAIDGGDYVRLIADDLEPHLRVSMASEKWRKQAGRLLKKLCCELCRIPTGDAVIGIQPAYGVYGEWHHFAFHHAPDYSLPALAGFRRFLKEKYGTTAALRKAWNDPAVTLGTADLASPEQRLESHCGNFRDPQQSRSVLDSLKFHQQLVPETIAYFARIIKENWDRSLLVGAFYGYYFNVATPHYSGGHLEIQRLYACEDIDYLAAPHAYMNNRPITGMPLPRGLLESARLHGKLWLTEMDQAPIGSAEQVGGTDDRREESIAIFRRNILDAVLRGAGNWYYDHRLVPGGSIFEKTGWWDHPVWMAEIAGLQRLAARVSEQPYRPQADVAMVYDTEMLYAVPEHPYNRICSEYLLLNGIGHTGATVDYLYLQDLPKADLDRYRCMIFVCTYVMDETIRRFIEERVKSDGRHLVFVSVAGYSDGNTLSLTRASQTVGIGLKTAEAAVKLTVGGNVYSTEAYQQPLFAVADAQATPLGTTETGEVGMAVRRHADHTVWYLPFPLDAAEVFRRVFREAGVHLYSQAGDVAVAGNDLLMLTVTKGGHRRIFLKNGHTAECDLPDNSTTLLDAESGKTVAIV
ncbi:MAG: hypothetical protein IJE00_05785 [Clostridia bacterium]|nr:hypothetical protein [Clostridia bacterium]